MKLLLIIIAFMCVTVQAQEVETNRFGDSIIVPTQEPQDIWSNDLQRFIDTPEDMHWELTVVKGPELIDTPVHFSAKHTCVQVGVAYMQADATLNGFVCELEEVT